MSSSTSGINRKSLKKPDNFTVWVKKGFEPLIKNKKALAAFVIAIALIIAGGFFLDHQSEIKAAQASNALFLAELKLDEDRTEAVKAYESSAGTQKAKDSEIDPSLKFTFSKIDVSQTYSKSLPLFEKVASQYSGTRAAFEANYRLGQLYYQHQDFQNALKSFQKAESEASQDVDRAFSFYSIGFSHENLGNSQEAITSFRSAINSFTNQNDSLKSEILMSIARNHRLLGEKDQAAAIYDEILKDYADTQSAQKATTLKAQL